MDSTNVHLKADQAIGKHTQTCILALRGAGIFIQQAASVTKMPAVAQAVTAPSLVNSSLVCSYYYVKSYAEGSGVIHLAAGIV